jgi:hypothetical protein
MKKLIILSVTILMACGGSLSEEQRKKLREGMEEQKIVKLSDAEITALSLDRGRTVFQELEQVKFEKSKIDSIAKANNVKISWIVPGTKNAKVLEQQLIEAYITALVNGSLEENIQKIYNTETPPDYDSLLYSKPVVAPMPDGVENLEGVWNIYLSRKEVILSSGKKH